MNSRTVTSLAVRTLVVSALVVNSLVAGPVLASSPAADRLPAPPTTESAASTFGSLPLAFEVNRGQVHASVRYVARGAGMTLFVTDTELVTVAGESVIRMEFPKARCIHAESELPGKANYIVDNDPSKWHADVPLFERVTLEAVFPGIDLVVYGTNGAPEYDFVVAPGADPSAISVVLTGASSMRIDDGGDLVLETPAGEIRHQRPVIYQAADGGRRPVSGAFTLARGRVGFRVGAYDRSRPLVIDPVLKFSTYVGGRKDDLPNDIAVDAGGNVYIVGRTESRDYPLRNPYESRAFGDDIFVTKLNASGTALVFSTLIGGPDADIGKGIAVDAAGRVFIAGSTLSFLYPMKNAYQIPPILDELEEDACLTVLTSAGNNLVYSTVLGGRDVDRAEDIAVDIHGNAFIVGKTFSKSFPVKSPSELPPFQPELDDPNLIADNSDAFAAKFDPDESDETSLVYSTFLGGTGEDVAFGVAVDEFERAYVTGSTESADFPVASAIQSQFGGVVDAFLTKFNADGTTVFFSTYYGGSDDDEGQGVAIDVPAVGDPLPVIAGVTQSADLPVQNAFQATFAGGVSDGFVAKFTGDGRQFDYATYIGGDSVDDCAAVAVDSDGNVLVTGSGRGTFPIRDPVLINGVEVRSGLFVARLRLDGSLALSTFIGDAVGKGIAVDANGDAYAVGETSSSAWPVTPGAFQSTRRGDIDGAVLKLDIIDDDTIGVWNPTTRTFLARNTNLPGAAELSVQFGVAGDKPLSGDWNGDGIDTIGAYTPSQGRFSLRNTNTAGAADLSFVFGAPNQQPLEGDWDGDGDDTIGVFDPATNSYFLRNSNDAGAADFVFTFGAGGQGAIAIAGDWNGDGVDTVGFYVPSTGEFFLINVNAGGNADLQFVFGPTNAVPVAGDWNADTLDTVGVAIVDPADGRKLRFLLTNVNATGPESLSVQFGNVGELAVVGNWDGQ